MGLLEDAVDALARAIDAPYEWTFAAVALVAGAALGWLVRAAILRFALPVAKRTPTDLDELVLKAIATPSGLTIAYLGALLAARSLWWQPEHDATFTRLLPTGLFVIWALALASLLSLVVLRASRHLRQGEGHGAMLLSRLGKVVVAILLGLSLLSLWGVSLTPLLASAGIVGIALALAAQDTLSNFFAGMAVVFDKLYQVGDYVVLDPGSEGEIRGEVRDIGLRSTRIQTRDDVLVVVPNSVIANGRVVNESGGGMRYRIRVGVDVAYDSDLEHVERVLLDVARGHPLVLAEPEARARVRVFGDSGIRVDLLTWVAEPKDRGLVVHELSMRVHKRFREEGIVIPFPQRDVRILRDG